MVKDGVLNEKQLERQGDLYCLRNWYRIWVDWYCNLLCKLVLLTLVRNDYYKYN